MADNKKDPGFLDHMRGTLVRGFLHQLSYTPLGMMMGLENPLKIGVNEGVKDIIRDAFFVVKYGSTGGDSHAGNKTADDFEQWYRKNITQRNGLGQSEFRMGVGWKIPQNTKYNGVLAPEGSEIVAVDAVFVRSKDGKTVEVMDHNDPRYVDMVLPYLATQLLSPNIAGKALSAIKGISATSKVVEVGSKVASVAGATGSVANTGLMASFVGLKAYDGMVLKPKAINELSHIIDKPQNFTANILRDKLNIVYEQYAYQNGFLNEQYYVPSIKNGESPYGRLNDLSRGIVTGAYEYKDPFDRKPKLPESVRLGDVMDHLRQNPDFRKSFTNLAYKAVSHRNLSDEETLALRFGMNVCMDAGFDLMAGNDVVKTGAKFSSAQKSETVNLLRSYLSSELAGAEIAVKYAGKNIPEDKLNKEVIEAQRKAEDSPFDAARLVPYLQSQITGLDSIIKARDDAKAAEAKKNTIQHIRTDNPFTFG